MTHKLEGMRFGRWLVVEKSAHRQYGQTTWLCRCDCGNEALVASALLTNNKSKSCGCYRKEYHLTHGKSGSLMHKRWSNMIQRCTNANNSEYHNYGGRGIKVCSRWRTFEYFLADMGEPPEGKTDLDRIDNNGDYEPNNCRWVSRSENLSNKRNNRNLTFEGRTQTMAQWSRELGINFKTLQLRIKYGWSVEKALTQKVQQRQRKMELEQSLR